MQDKIALILKRELVPTLGCSEPMAYGLCGAIARKHAKGEIESITIEASTSMIKGVQYVKIPKSGGLRGAMLSTAIGAYGGNPDHYTEVFHEVTPEDVKLAKSLVESGKVTLLRTTGPLKLHLKVTVLSTEGKGIAMIQQRQSNVVYIEEDGEIVKDTRDADFVESGVPDIAEDEEVDYSILNMQNIYEFCKNAPMEKLLPAKEAIEINSKISMDGLDNQYGLQTGKALKRKLGEGVVSDDLAMQSVIWAAAGVDARMGGSPLVAMSNYGSGNQGITCTMAVVAAGKFLNKSAEDILRAVALSHLVTIFIKTYTGKTSSFMGAICGATIAAGGASCGVAFLREADCDTLSHILQTVLGTVVGLFCDGAKSNCATKVAMSVHSAMQAMLLAEDGIGADEFNGVVGQTVEDTIVNFYRIQQEGMKDIMNVLYSIEEDKGHLC